MTNLVAKYDISQHLDRLNERYPITAENYLQPIPKDDEDYAVILAMRRECDHNDHRRKRRPMWETNKIFRRRKQWILAQIVAGKSLASIAKQTTIPLGSLKHFVKRDPVTNAAHQSAVVKRKEERCDAANGLKSRH